MPSLVAISQAKTEINKGAESAPPQALSVSNRPGQIVLRKCIFLLHFESLIFESL